MKKHILPFIIFGLILSTTNVRSQVTLEETTLDTTTLISGLNIPWEIQWGPDDWLWVTERYGRVSRINPETGEQQVILDYTNQVHQEGESGMLGMVHDPDFDQNHKVYIVYTYSSAGGIGERISVFTYQNNHLTNENVLLEGIPGNVNHDGSRLRFAPDGKIMMTTGDALDQQGAQDTTTLNGKILRLNTDGSVPADNPFGPQNYVYTYGHRNPQGLVYGPTGILYSSEHGPSTDDEVNIIEAGRNYGWPVVKGFCDEPAEMDFCRQHNVKEPMINWTPTIAPSDIIYYASDAIPEWKNTILLTVLKDMRVVELELSDDGTQITAQKQWFVGYWGRLRDICAGPQGELYIATNGQSWSNNNPFTHSIIKLVPRGSSTGDLRKSGDSMIRILNDSSGNIRVQFDDALCGKNFWVYTTDGRQIETGRLATRPKTLKASLYKPGIYLLSVAGDQQMPFAKKFIVP